MGNGGAERVMCILANRWADGGHEVTLLSLSADAPFYHLDDRVRHVRLGVDSVSRTLYEGLWANARKLRVLRKAITDAMPDVIVSFLDTTNVLTILSTAGLPMPIVVSERVDPVYNTELSRSWRLLRWITYPFAERVIVQTKAVLERRSPMRKQNVGVIPNPVERPGARHDALNAAMRDRKWIIGMGRLTAQKGFDMLLDAFAEVAPRHPDWGLRIIGDGPCRVSLEKQTHHLGLEGRILLPGRTRDPYPILAESSLFVLSSRFEGFPNALCEAMACGLPAISFDCPSGPSEIMRNGVDGVLVPREDVSGLAGAMDELMGDPQTRHRFSLRAPEVIERFGIERVLDLWEELFSEVR